MKNVSRDQHILHVLKNNKCKKFQKAILQNCDDKFIQTLAEIVHNVLKGNIRLDAKDLRKLKKYKTQLRKIHASIKKNRATKSRRKLFSNQIGGFWPVLAGLALQSLAGLGVDKLIDYGYDKVKSFVKGDSPITTTAANH